MLEVNIHSFSYKQSGIPKDLSENGGGFVFDCRFIENPGRHIEFATLNGKDSKVITFLENNSKMQEFLNNVFNIIDNAIENYTGRKFSYLMVSFGCTGGRHRSVYGAEKLKQHLNDKFKDIILVRLTHNDL